MNKVLESSVIFFSVLKWIALASIAGIVVGASTALFLKFLEYAINFASLHKYYFLFLPFAFLFSTFLTKTLAPQAEGHGTEKIIEAIHKQSGKMNVLAVPVKLVATVITIASGGSVGKEGPCAQIGAGLCSFISDIFDFNDTDRKKLVICGISAGFAAVFGTPIAGAIFGVEVLVVGGMLYEVLLPSFVSGLVGYQIALSLGVTYHHVVVEYLPHMSMIFFLKACVSGIFFGFCSLLFIEMLKFFNKTVKKINLRWQFKTMLGGIILIALSFIFSTRYLGLGLETISEALLGENIPLEAFLIKILFTSLTLSFGGSGGIVTPIFFIGATSGNLFGHLPGFDPSVFAAIGMVSLLAGAANTPISAGIMAAELFGPSLAPYAAVASVITFLITGHRSVYASQLLAIAKSSSLAISKISDMDESDVHYKPRKKTISVSFGRKIKRFFKKKKQS